MKYRLHNGLAGTLLYLACRTALSCYLTVSYRTNNLKEIGTCCTDGPEEMQALQTFVFHQKRGRK